MLSDRRPAPGAPRTGLESALEGALHQHEGVWLARHVETEPAGGAALAAAFAGDEWPVLEAAPDAPAPMERWLDYVCANMAYAERIVESLRPGGAVWIHGRRWLLVASALRDHGHRGPIGLLLDVPFPAPASFEALPWHADVIAAMCELDLLGLRTPSCAERFEAACARAGRRPPAIGVFPEVVEPAGAGEPAAWVPRFLHLLVSADDRDPQRSFAG